MTDYMGQTEEAERNVNNEPQMEQNREADRANEQEKELLARIQGYHQHISHCTHEMTKTKIADYDDFTRIRNFMSLAKMDLAERV